ncbi:hypothetical protein BDR22DRAFT_817244 [Usnea florida]
MSLLRTPETSKISPTSFRSHTSHTSHKSHTSHTSTHRITAPTKSPTTPAFAVATQCTEDNKLHALITNLEDASTFCPLYLGAQSHVSVLPIYVSHFGRSQIKSACSCFEAGSSSVRSAAQIMKTEAELTLTIKPPSSRTTVSSRVSSASSSKLSAARESMTEGKKTSPASVPSPSRFAVIVVSVLVIFPGLAVLNGV